jgi:hypothetical protein
MSSETSSPVVKWILIVLSGISVLCIAFFIVLMTRPVDEYRVADELQARGFHVEYERHEIWQRPFQVWGDGLSITEDDSRLICQLPHLQALAFQCCDLSGLNLDDIGNCQGLWCFHCEDVTLFPADEIRKLAACPINTFHYTKSPLNDSDLKDFAKWAKGVFLDLNDNAGITDAGLEHLEKIASLQYLGLVRTSVTREGVEEFRRKRPDVTVLF